MVGTFLDADFDIWATISTEFAELRRGETAENQQPDYRDKDTDETTINEHAFLPLRKRPQQESSAGMAV